ncbi:hypothetical protein [Arthrobacter sp. SAFR-014]|uniref:hypothetical protein n=1 Tax=unclassified Arthrobacter TaxID=235627 RepID=UPI003F7C7AE0
MHGLANFIGELGGESWTTQAVAAIIGAVLVLIAAVVTAIVAIRQGQANRDAAANQIADVIKKDRDLALASAEKDRELAAKTAEKDRELAKETGERERELKAREQWWQRFKTVCDDVTSNDEKKGIVAVILMEQLLDSTWAAARDKLMAAAVLEVVNRPAEEQMKARAKEGSQQ